MRRLLLASALVALALPAPLGAQEMTDRIVINGYTNFEFSKQLSAQGKGDKNGSLARFGDVDADRWRHTLRKASGLLKDSPEIQVSELELSAWHRQQRFLADRSRSPHWPRRDRRRDQWPDYLPTMLCHLLPR